MQKRYGNDFFLNFFNNQITVPMRWVMIAYFDLNGLLSTYYFFILFLTKIIN